MKGYWKRMILLSIVTKNSMVFCLVLAILGCDKAEIRREAQPEIRVNPNSNLDSNKDSIYSQCTPPNCSLYVFSRKAGPRFLRELMKEPTISNLSADIQKFVESCGNPCNYTTYFERSTGKISDPYPEVIAEDLSSKKVAYLDSTTVVVTCMFPCPDFTSRFHPPLSKEIAAPRHAFQEAKLFKNKLVITFLTGKDMTEITDTLNFSSSSTISDAP